MSTEPRTATINLLTVQPLEVDEPAWCAGHPDPDSDEAGARFRVDITHDTQPIVFKLDGVPVGEALISQAPFADRGTREIQGFLSLHYGEDRGRSPAELYDLAAAIEGHADQLRELADRLARILDGGEGQ
ncbi:DUF6907 domain-containing protein [Streptomyces sp. NPDC056628]|uniref:DUF6907 domain-containing protein n=1 Tax=Streptomyces sp. NPDC056628 TaxID=3345882 RepID=UPI0036B6ADAF